MDLPLTTERLGAPTRPLRAAREAVLPATRRELSTDAPVITHMAPPSFAAEQYRALAVQIEEQVNPLGTWGYALAVTSAEEGAGKTLTSLNLALALARGEERRVLLVEADLWRPQLHTYLDPAIPATPATPMDAGGPGLFQLLERRLPLAEAVVGVAGTSLDLLLAGTDGEAGDVLSGRRMSEALTEMRAAYEIVVIDSPPMALLASARSLAARSDGALLVVRASQSRRKEIERALQILGPDKLIGVVLNAARISRRGYRSYE
jgi:protein-tyrosine kinase